MPVFNSEEFVQDAVNSVINQKYCNWELIIVNDGSEDNSEKIIKSFSDHRIIYKKQNNRGVSAARNLGLELMSGEYYCFLDADDYLTPTSLLNRIEYFRINPKTDFVDGKIVIYDSRLKFIEKFWRPKRVQNTLKDLVTLRGNCFFNGSWLIKRSVETDVVKFNESISHGEDLLYLMELCKTKSGDYLYGFVNNEILYYRLSNSSAMQNIKGLERGYKGVFKVIKKWTEINKFDLLNYYLKFKKIIFLSYIKKGDYTEACKSLI